jgi:hypothetical protein
MTDLTTSATSDRKSVWRPHARPEWVQRINAEGAHLDLESVVPLDEDSLIKEAIANTGLDDFGDDNWREPFSVFIDGVNKEAELNLMGRLMTRSDLLHFLQARLQIEDTYKKHPEIGDEVIKDPIYIVGQGRTGTSFLQSILGEDPDNGTLTNWETFFPCPPPEAATYDTDPRIDKADKLIGMWNRVAPEIESMHEFYGAGPTENIHLHCLSFRSPAWMMLLGQVPSYAAYMMQQDGTIQYEYEKRVLKLLQWKNPRKRWVMKSPAALYDMPNIVKVYPDARFIWTHRDPVKAVASVVSLVGTLFWMRTDHPFSGGALDQVVDSDMAGMGMSIPIDWMEQGIVPKDQIANILYQDFVWHPMATVGRVYDELGLRLSEAASQKMQAYVDTHLRMDRPAHRYEFGSDEIISHDRDVFKRYQEYFDIPNEI